MDQLFFKFLFGVFMFFLCLHGQTTVSIHVLKSKFSYFKANLNRAYGVQQIWETEKRQQKYNHIHKQNKERNRVYGQVRRPERHAGLDKCWQKIKYSV